MNYITDVYPSANRRLFLLDYDGTLVPFTDKPHQSVPPETLRQLLKSLADNPRNHVVIISGRDHPTLQKWLGDLPIDFSAEHGFWIRQNSEWRATTKLDTSWKDTVRDHIQQAISKLPQSFLEEKHASLSWHYRMSDQAAAPTIAKRLINDLGKHPELAQCTILDGNKVVEIKPSGFDKGSAAQNWLNSKYDFVLAAGDDVTDEQLFAALPSHGHSIKIGDLETSAKSRLDRQEFLDLLHTLTQSTDK